MPVSEKTMRSMDRLNVLFAVSSGLLLASILWFAVIDYDLQWRGFQNDYMTVQGVLAHLDYLYTQRESEQEKLREAQTRLEAARQQVLASQADLDRMTEELEDLKAKFALTKLQYGPVANVHDVTLQAYEHALALHGPDDPHTLELLHRKEHERELIATFGKTKQEQEDAMADLTRRIKDLRAPEVEAQKAYDALARQATEAEAKAEQYGGKLRRTLFNAPMFDFAAPKNTPGRHEIKQLVLPDVRQELNYLQSYTTDRCVTCHIAIDNRDFTMEALAAKFEKGIPSINEQRAKLGRPALPTPAPPELSGEDAPKVEPGDVMKHWDRLTDDQQRAYFDALLATINQYLKEEDKNSVELSRAILAHPNLDLFVQIDSPHPMKTMGCTVCHEGNPQETTFILAAHRPTGHKQQEEWKEKYYVNVTGVPTATFELINHYWDRHMLPTRYTEGSCMKCHQQPSSIHAFNGEPQGEKIRKGYDLFTRVGCINCHSVKGLEDSPRVGPSLAHIESKLDPEFTAQWIWDPRAFRPSTWMPHFFLQENNGPGSESDWDPDPVLRTQTEVQAITHYLYTASQPWEGAEKPPQGLTGDAETGRKLFTSVGCLACHGNLSEFGEAWIVRDRREKGETPEQAKANFDAMNYVERVRYAMDHFPGDTEALFDPESVRFDSRKPYNAPVFTRVAPELSAMGSKTTVEWMYAWLREPSGYHTDTRMPSLRLTEQEALDVATYLSGLKLDSGKDGFGKERFPDDAKRDAEVDRLMFDLLSAQRSAARSRAVMDDKGGELTKMIEDFVANSPSAEGFKAKAAKMSLAEKRLLYVGNKAISHYGCYACHLIPGFENAVRPGTELTVWAQKPITQLDFAFFGHAGHDIQHREENHALFEHIYPPHRPDLVEVHHGVNPPQDVTHDHAAFAYHKMLNPRMWDRLKEKKPLDKLKMPNFFFTEDEAEALVTYLMGRTSPRVSSSLVVNYENDPRDRIGEGRDLTRRFNCVGCHQIEDNFPVVQQYFRVKEGGRERFDEVNAPPALRGQGAKSQPAWLFAFLNNVEMLRPWLTVRMPSFHITGDDSRAIVEHFSGLGNEEARQLNQRLRLVDGYIAEETKKAEGATNGDAAAQAGADWFAQDHLAKSTGFLGRYAVANRLMMPFQLDSGENSPEELAANYHKVHTETSLLRDLYNARYPFADVPPTAVAADRFQKGEEMLLTLGCLKCHVLGDSTVPGSNPNPSAPNLNLTFRRLQQDWVRAWVKAPAVIQPGTKMPQLWPNMQSAFANFENREELEAKFGRTAEEQISLLLDYLYAAGLRNHTAIDPNVAAAPAGEGGDFIEEDEPAEEFIEDE